MHKKHACTRVYTHGHVCSWFDTRGISIISVHRQYPAIDMPSYLAIVIVDQPVYLWLYIVDLRRSLAVSVHDNHVQISN